MTSLLSAPRSPNRTPSSDVATRRPLALVTSLGGAAAAGSTLMVCLALGVIGWFGTDAGAHGTPRDGLRTGALGWLMAHGSGVSVQGARVTVLPLGLTLICVWVTWRLAQRVGESVSGHGPDADAIVDGERDWTVPAAVALFGAGYVVVSVLTGVLASTPTTTPSNGRAVAFSLLLTLVVAGPAIAIGSGRAAIWTALLPPSVLATAAVAGRILRWFLVASALLVIGSLLVHAGSAANVLSRLHLGTGEAALFLLANAVVLPNAVLCGGSYLLGPGFTVGTGTLVSPTLVSIGPLPAVPLLAALPDNGTGSWTMGFLAAPFLISFAATAYTLRRQPTTAWDEGALRGCVGGAVAGLVFAVLALAAGGAAGPGRMRDVAPYAFDCLLHGIVGFGLGGLLAGLAMTWAARRSADSAA